MKKVIIPLFCLFSFSIVAVKSGGYPIDGYKLTQIRRLARLELIVAGGTKEKMPIAGMLKSINDIKLNLIGERGDSLSSIPEPDAELQRSINALFPGLNESYSITVLDITPGKKIRYAQRQEKRGYQPGSVGKLAVLTGLFAELAKIYPDCFEDRQLLLCNKSVRGGQWALKDGHTVPFYNPATNEFVKRTVAASDVFTLYEWADHMISVSNNGAASVVWREVLLMHVFGQQYPELTDDQANEYFKTTPKSELSKIANEVVNQPLRDIGIAQDEWRLGSFFTHGASNMITGIGGSIGTPLALMKFMIAMERGLIVDSASSLEMKRLMYQTDRRIRYASSPALNEAAVYFKSGSLYKCKTEEGFQCGKYKGNVENYMNSVCIVEQPNGATYMVCLMSNVLRKNSNLDHLALASRIDAIINKNPKEG